jgi:NADPH:quinone reductase-like Zn-dependent oxidoreductase
MKAIRYHSYGGPEVLVLEDVDEPVVGDRDVLVRVRASSVNPADRLMVRGAPDVLRLRAGLFRPRDPSLGFDVAGVVVAVGARVSDFEPGDEVFAWQQGAFAEYVAVPAAGPIVLKPEAVTFEQAGGVAVAGVSALRALRDGGGLAAGRRVLVTGAAGGVGTFAVQIAAAHGAEVTGECGTAGLGLVGALGATHVADARSGDALAGGPYDLVVDTTAGRPPRAFRQALTRHGTYVAVGGPGRGRPFATTVLRPPSAHRRTPPPLARAHREDLAVLGDLMADGRVVPVVDRVFPLAGVPDAIRHLDHRHARGKVVITV